MKSINLFSRIFLTLLIIYKVSAASDYLGSNISKGIQQLHQDQLDTQELVSQLADEVKDMKTYLRELLPADCYSAKLRGSWSSKTLVSPPELPPRRVLCDQQTAGGGWTVVLRRQPLQRHLTRENFNCTWDTYKSQFGSLDGEFWIGLDVLHALTAETPHELLVKITDDNGSYSAQWKTFSVGSEEDDFRLNIGDYQSDDVIFDALSKHDNMKFSTYDRDNTQYEHGHCGHTYGGGWWYNRCHHALLTGDPSTAMETKMHGIRWYNKKPHGKSHWMNLTHATMMIRPKVS